MSNLNRRENQLLGQITRNEEHKAQDLFTITAEMEINQSGKSRRKAYAYLHGGASYLSSWRVGGHQALKRLLDDGFVVRVSHGRYRMVKHED